MVYYGSYMTEGIVFHVNGDVDDFCIIALTKDLDGKTFTVEADFDPDWQWKFMNDYPGNYEMVKHMIMDIAFDSDNEDELLMNLNEVFKELFNEIATQGECASNCDCETGCKHCGHK